MIAELQKHRAALGKVIDKAEGMHDELEKQAQLLTSDGADAMAEVRRCCDALELSVSDECGRCRSTERCSSRSERPWRAP